MLHFYNRALLEGALMLRLEPELHSLLAERVQHLAVGWLLDSTEIVVVDRGTSEADLLDAVGMTLLRNPIDGRRYPEFGFAPWWDYLAKVSPSYWEAIVCIGNSSFAVHLLIHEEADAELVALCKEYAA